MNVGLGKGATNIAQLLDKTGFSKELSKVMLAAESGLGLDSTLKSMAQSFEQVLGSAPGGLGAAQAGQGLSSGEMEKVLYLSVLRGAMQKASESKHFNVETHINDLWVKLSQVRQSKSNEGLLKVQALLAKQSQLMQMLSDISRKYNDAARSVIQNLR